MNIIRRPISAFTYMGGLCVFCDDGTAWMLIAGPPMTTLAPNKKFTWERMPDFPIFAAEHDKPKEK